MFRIIHDILYLKVARSLIGPRESSPSITGDLGKNNYHINPHLHIWDMTKRDKYPTNIR